MEKPIVATVTKTRIVVEVHAAKREALILFVTIIMLTSLIFIFNGTLSICVMITDVTEGY
jgi:hypothetical protein